MTDATEVAPALVQSAVRTYAVTPRSHRPRFEVSARRLARRPQVARVRHAVGDVLRQLGLKRKVR
jgi:hypothetical protein